MTKRTLTLLELGEAARKFMSDNYPDLKREDPDRYYTLLYTLYAFATELIPIENDSDND